MQTLFFRKKKTQSPAAANGMKDKNGKNKRHVHSFNLLRVVGSPHHKRKSRDSDKW